MATRLIEFPSGAIRTTGELRRFLRLGSVAVLHRRRSNANRRARAGVLTAADIGSGSLVSPTAFDRILGPNYSSMRDTRHQPTDFDPRAILRYSRRKRYGPEEKVLSC